MPKPLPRNPTLRLLLIIAVIVSVIVGGYFGGRHLVWPMFKSWREQRANAVARNFLEKGDYTNALLAVRKTLTYNQLNVAAWRLGVEITEKQNTPEVIAYQKRLADAQPTFENRLKLIQLALKYHAFLEADAMIAKVGAQGANSPEFLEDAALVSRRLGNATKSKYYLMSLISLQPENNVARLDLAQLRLLEGVDENKPSIRAEIRNLSTDPALRARALAMLITDSLQSKDSAESLKLADQLAELPDVIPTTEILVMEAYRRYSHSHFKTYLEQDEKSSATEPDKVIILTSYLIANSMADETRHYIESLDPKIRNVENVQLSYAYALVTLKDWDEVETFLRGCKWSDNEYARYALLAYRYRVAGRDRDFNEAWRLAVIEVGNNAHRLQTLLSQVSDWGWTDQKYELLWKRFLTEPANQGVRNELIVYERKRADTSALNRLFARLIELDPSEMDSKNNYAYTSMLLGINLDRAYEAAAELNRAKPHNPFYATTNALALYRQGKYADALQLIQSLDAVALSDSTRTLLESVILIANGKFEEGASLAAPLNTADFLPEERRLLTDSLALVEKSRAQTGSIARMAELNSEHAGSDRKSFLHLLPATLNQNPTVQMSLADSLYGSDDYKGLEENLKSAQWDDRDFLRNALLAYAERQQGHRESDAGQTWRVSLASAGNTEANLSALKTLAQTWGWQPEYLEIANRLFQRNSSDDITFQELAKFYSNGNQTADLARIYQLHLDSNPNDNEAKSRFAYYSLLINSNLSRAYGMAKEAYDDQPQNAFRAKVYAFALYKQSRSSDGWDLVDKLGDAKEKGLLQLSLVKAALAAQQNQFKQARTLLDDFDPASALPEEAALADSIAKSIAAQNS